MAIVTGGTPKTVGAYYDVAYDRVPAPPTIDTGNGLLHGPSKHRGLPTISENPERCIKCVVQILLR
jgi:hypothetical protein